MLKLKRRAEKNTMSELLSRDQKVSVSTAKRRIEIDLKGLVNNVQCMVMSLFKSSQLKESFMKYHLVLIKRKVGEN